MYQWEVKVSEKGRVGQRNAGILNIIIPDSQNMQWLLHFYFACVMYNSLIRYYTSRTTSMHTDSTRNSNNTEMMDWILQVCYKLYLKLATGFNTNWRSGEFNIVRDLISHHAVMQVLCPQIMCVTHAVIVMLIVLHQNSYFSCVI